MSFSRISAYESPSTTIIYENDRKSKADFMKHKLKKCGFSTKKLSKSPLEWNNLELEFRFLRIFNHKSRDITP